MATYKTYTADLQLNFDEIFLLIAQNHLLFRS